MDPVKARNSLWPNETIERSKLQRSNCAASTETRVLLRASRTRRSNTSRYRRPAAQLSSKLFSPWSKPGAIEAVLNERLRYLQKPNSSWHGQTFNDGTTAVSCPYYGADLGVRMHTKTGLAD
jgi:hypothetical protein